MIKYGYIFYGNFIDLFYEILFIEVYKCLIKGIFCGDCRYD